MKAYLQLYGYIPADDGNSRQVGVAAAIPDTTKSLILFFDCRFHTHHTRVPTQKLNEICVHVY